MRKNMLLSLLPSYETQTAESTPQCQLTEAWIFCFPSAEKVFGNVCLGCHGFDVEILDVLCKLIFAQKRARLLFDHPTSQKVSFAEVTKKHIFLTTNET